MLFFNKNKEEYAEGKKWWYKWKEKQKFLALF